jgi:hypothetical protein
MQGQYTHMVPDTIFLIVLPLASQYEYIQNNCFIYKLCDIFNVKVLYAYFHNGKQTRADQTRQANRGSRMKKTLLFFVLVIGCSAHVFSINEIMGSLGFNYGNIFESYNSGDVTSFMGSPGIALNYSRSFEGKNFGFFGHTFFGFPQSVYTKKNGMETKTSLESGMQLGMCMGLAFFFPINEQFIFQPSVGINSTMTEVTYFEYAPSIGADESITSWSVSLGIGSNIGIVYRITKSFALNLGSLFVFDFIKTGIRNWAKNYFLFTARPYVSVCVYTYRQRD